MTTLILPDPTTIPKGPGFSSISLASVFRTMSHETNGARILTQQTAGQYWQIDIGYTDLTIEEAAPLLHFLYAIKGMHTPFYVRLPTFCNPKNGSMGNVSLANATPNQYGNTLTFTNWNAVANQTSSTLQVGDPLKTTDSDKVYIITAASYSVTGSGTATFTIQPDLVVKTTSQTKLVTDDIKFRVKLLDDTISHTINTDLYVNSFGLKMRETTS